MQPHRPKKRWKIGLFAAVALALLAFGAVLALRTSSLEPELKRIRAAGYPVSAEDLNAWYPPVTAESNAALGVIKAIEIRNSEQAQILLPKRGEEISPTNLSAIRDYLNNNTATLQTLHTAVQLPESRYPVTLSSTTVATGAANPHLGQIKAMAQLLYLETVHLVSQGHSAFSPVRDGFALAATLRNEPMLLSELVRIACVAIALRSLECSLPAGKFTAPELLELSAWLNRTEADCSRSWQRAVVGERTFGLQYFATKLIAPRPSRPPGPNQSNAFGFGENVYRGLGFHDRDRRLYLEIMSRFSTAMTNPFPVAYQESVALEKELTARFSSGFGRFALLSRAMLPAMIKSTGREAALITHLRCAQTAIAVERYRLANNGTLPENLAELVPQFLPELPRDAAQGEPLLLERLPLGYQISSPTAAKILDNKISILFPVVPWKFGIN